MMMMMMMILSEGDLVRSPWNHHIIIIIIASVFQSENENATTYPLFAAKAFLPTFVFSLAVFPLISPSAWRRVVGRWWWFRCSIFNYGPFVRLRAHSKQMMRALCAAAAARRKGVDGDDDDSNRRPNKSLLKTKDKTVLLLSKSTVATRRAPPRKTKVSFLMPMFLKRPTFSPFEVTIFFFFHPKNHFNI